MATRILTVDPANPDPDAMAEAAAVVKRGGLVAFPTETVYGLGAHALDRTAVTAIFRAKGRPATDPIIVHLADPDALTTVARDVPDAAIALARAFWPGALTLVLRRRDEVPELVTAGLPTVGVRVPSHPVAACFLRRAGIPIAAPSANRFSRPSPTTAAHVLDDLEGLIDLVIDAGPTPIGIESTIVDLTVTPPLMRRPGGVTERAIRQILPTVQIAAGYGSEIDAQAAPGQLLRHYAPRARVTLYLGGVTRVAERLARDARTEAAAGRQVGVLAPEEDLRELAPRLAASAAFGRVRTVRYGSRRHPEEAAHDLFAALRHLDAEGVDVILASAPGPDAVGLAIIDRLTRAAEGRVVNLQE